MLRTLVCVSLIVPAVSSFPLTKWNLHVWQRLRSAKREAPQTATDRYFRTVLPYVPASGEIGLVQIGPTRAEDAVRVHYVLQYALAPRLLVLSPDREFVLAYGPTSLNAFPDDETFQLVRVFGDGLRLFRRVAR